MPADCLSLAVRVRCEINAVRLFHFLAELREDLSLAADGDVFRLIVVIHVDPQLGLRKIPHMALACVHGIIAAEELFDGLYLCRRLNDDKIV